MQKVIAISTVLMLVGLVAAQPVLAGKIPERHFKQDKRIFQGINSGELTRGEFQRLIKQQHWTQQCKNRAWSDGRLTWKERGGMEKLQKRASANIYRLKHNDRDRY